MNTLLRPELERFLTRRATWVGGLVATVLILVIGVTTGPSVGSGRRRYTLTVSGGDDVLMVVAMFGSALAYFAAAAYAGSEQSNGALGTWLTFNPRRVRVYAAKLITVAVPAFCYGVLACAAHLGLLLLRYPARPDAVAELAWLGLRVGVAVASFAVLGLVVAVIGRSTLAALGALLAYLVLVVLRAFIGTVLHLYPSEWVGPEKLLGDFLLAEHPPVHDHRMTIVDNPYFDYSAIAAAGTGWLLLMVLAAVIGGLVFVRRDVN